MSSTPSSKGKQKQKREASFSCTFNKYDYEGLNYLDSYQIKQYIRTEYKLDLPDYVVKQIINDKVIGADKVHVHREDFPAVDTYIKKKREELEKQYGFTDFEQLGVYNQEKEYEKHQFSLPFPKLRNEPRLLSSIQTGNKISGYTFQAAVSRPFSDSSIVMTNYMKPLDQLSIPSPYFQSNRFKSLMSEFSESQDALGKSDVKNQRFTYFTPLYEPYTLRTKDQSIFEFLSPDDSISYLPISKKDDKADLFLYKISINKLTFETENNENLLCQFFFFDKKTKKKITETCGIYRIEGELQKGFVLFECTPEVIKNAFFVIRVARESDNLFENYKKQYEQFGKTKQSMKQSSANSQPIVTPTPTVGRSSETPSTNTQTVGRFSEPPVPIKSTSCVAIKPKKNEDVRHIQKPEFICLGVSNDVHTDAKVLTYSGDLVLGDDWESFVEQYRPQNLSASGVFGMFSNSPISVGKFECTVVKLTKEWNVSYKVFDCCRNQTMVMGDENIYSLEYLEKREKSRMPLDMYGDSLFIYLNEMNLGKDKKHNFFNVTARLFDAKDPTSSFKVFYPQTLKESLQTQFVSASYSTLKTIKMDDEIKIKLPTPIEKSYCILFTITEYSVNSPNSIEKQRFAILPLYDNEKPIGDKSISLRLANAMPQVRVPTVLEFIDKGNLMKLTIKSLAAGYPSHVELYDYFATKGADNIQNMMNIPKATLLEYISPILQKEFQNIKVVSGDQKKVMALINFLHYVCPTEYPNSKHIILQKFLTTFNPLIIEPLQFANYVLIIIIGVLQSFNDSHKIFDLLWFFLGLVEKSVVAYLQTKRAAGIEESILYSGVLAKQLEDNLYVIADSFGGWMVLNQNRITPQLVSLVHANTYFAEFMRSMLYLWRIGKVAEIIEKYLNVVCLPISETRSDNKRFVNLPYLLRFDFLNSLRDFDYLYEKDCPKPLVFKETAELPDIMEKEHFFHGLLIRHYIKLIVKDIKKSDVDGDSATKTLKFVVSKMAILSIGSLIQKYDTLKHYDNLKQQIASLLFPLVSYAIEEKTFFENNSNVPYGLLQKESSKWTGDDYEQLFVWKVFFSSLIWVLKNVEKETMLLYFEKEVSTRICDLLFQLTSAIRFISVMGPKKHNVNVGYDNARLQLIGMILKGSSIEVLSIPIFNSRIVRVDFNDEYSSQLGILDTAYHLSKRRGTLASNEQHSFHGQKNTKPSKGRRSFTKESAEIVSSVEYMKAMSNSQISPTLSPKPSTDENVRPKTKKPSKFVGFTLKIAETLKPGKKKTGNANQSEAITDLSDVSSDESQKLRKEKMAMVVLQHFLLRTILRTVMDSIDMLLYKRDFVGTDIESVLSKLLEAVIIETPLNGVVTLPIVDFMFMLIISHSAVILKSEDLSQCILKSLLKMGNSDEDLLNDFSSKLLFLSLKSEFLLTNKTSLTSSNIVGLIAQWEYHHVKRLENCISTISTISSQFIELNDIALKNAISLANSNVYGDYIWIERLKSLSNGVSIGSFSDVCGFLKKSIQIAFEGFRAGELVPSTLSCNNTSFLQGYYNDVFDSVPFDRTLLEKMAHFCAARFTGKLREFSLELINSVSKDYDIFCDEYNLKKKRTKNEQLGFKIRHDNCIKAKSIGERIFEWARKSSFLQYYFEEEIQDDKLKEIHQQIATKICQANEESTKMLDEYETACNGIGEINPLFPITLEEMKKMVKMVIELLEEQISKIQHIVEVRKNYEQKRIEIDSLNSENARIIKTNSNAISKSLLHGPVSVKYFSARILELKNLEEVTKDMRTRRNQRQGEFSGFMAPWESFFFFWESILKKEIELNSVIEGLMLRVVVNEKEVVLASKLRVEQETFARAAFRTYSWIEMSLFLKGLRISERTELIFIMDIIANQMKSNKFDLDICEKMNLTLENYNKIIREKESLLAQFKKDLQKNGCLRIKGFDMIDLSKNSICAVDHGIQEDAFGMSWYKLILDKYVSKETKGINQDINWLIDYEDCYEKKSNLEKGFEVQRREFADSFKLLTTTYGEKLSENNVETLTRIVSTLDDLALKQVPEIVKYCEPPKIPISINIIKKEIKEYKLGKKQVGGEIVKVEETQISDEEMKKTQIENELYSFFLDEKNSYRITSIIDNSLYLTKQFNEEIVNTDKTAKDIFTRQKDLWKYEKKNGKGNINDIDELLELLSANAEKYVNAPMLFLTWVERSAEINRKNNRYAIAGICEVVCMNYIYCILRDSQQGNNLDLFDFSVIEELFQDVLKSADIQLVANYSNCSFETMIKHAWLAVGDFELSEQWFAHQMCCFLLPYYRCSFNISELAKVHDTLTKVCQKMSSKSSPMNFYHVHFSLNRPSSGKDKPSHYIYSSFLNYDEFVADIKKTPIAQRVKIVETPTDDNSEKIVIQQVYLYIDGKVVAEKPTHFTPTNQFVYERDVLYSNQRENKKDGSSSVSTFSANGESTIILDTIPLLQIGVKRLVISTKSRLPSSQRRVVVEKRRLVTLTPIEKAIEYASRINDQLEEFNVHIQESQKNNEIFDHTIQEEIKKTLYRVLCDDKWKLCDVAKTFLIDDVDEAVSSTIGKYIELFDGLSKVQITCKKTVDLYILGDPEDEKIEEISRIKKYFLSFVNNLTIGKGLLDKRRHEMD